jgi:hypothetical protein
MRRVEPLQQGPADGRIDLGNPAEMVRIATTTLGNCI